MKKGNFLNSMIGNKLGKVLVTTAIASLGFCFGAYSQDDNDPSDIIKAEEESDVGKLWFGFRAGVSASTFGDNTSSFDLMDGNGTLNSFTGGVFVRYQALEWLAIQPEVSFLQTGDNRINYTETNITNDFFSGPYDAARFEVPVTSRDLLNSVDASLNAVFTPKKFLPKLRPYFTFGPSFGFIVNATARETKQLQFAYGDNTRTYDAVNTTDVSSYYRVFDFALNYGVGSQFNIFGNTGFVELRYRWGLSNISNYPQIQFTRDDLDLPNSRSGRGSYAPQDLTNHTITLTTGIMFGGKSTKKKADDADAEEAASEETEE